MSRFARAATYYVSEVAAFAVGALALFGLACLAVAGLGLAVTVLLCGAVREEFAYLVDRLRGRV